MSRLTEAPDPMDLVLLIEECGEVIQAASKALRFGWEHSWPDYEGGMANSTAVAKEIGQLMACVDRLGIDPHAIALARVEKHEKLERFGPKVFGRGMLMLDPAALALSEKPEEQGRSPWDQRITR